ncbi:MAG: hypothetical protein M0T84_11955 [Betaproteobacteria bacterium]|nr:hypothetical protein [Betaproteobacteria bacterium]
MGIHYPFSGKADRVTVFSFYERLGLAPPLQEKYYQWWYDWAKAFVRQDPDLRLSKGPEFSRYPYGQHAQRDFHLHDCQWSTTLLELGQFIDNAILPRLDGTALEALERQHAQLVAALTQEARARPRQAAPEIGYFRHT